MVVESLTSLIDNTKGLMEAKDYDAVVSKCTEALEEYPASSTLYINRYYNPFCF